MLEKNKVIVQLEDFGFLSPVQFMSVSEKQGCISGETKRMAVHRDVKLTMIR